jgi:hypothetical protein
MSDPSVINISLENLLTHEVHELRVPAVIGRHEDCDLVLDGERGASRKHARVTLEDDLVVLMDLGSLNGTMVNGHEIHRPVQLADGDVVLFDKQEYRIAISPSTTDVSQNVTVIANKAEIGIPEHIKPAIQVLDDKPAAIDEPIEERTDESIVESVDEEFDLDGFGAVQDEPIAATSRPGGHTPSIDAQRHANRPTGRSSAFRWIFILTVLILLILFIAYLNNIQIPRFW